MPRPKRADSMSIAYLTAVIAERRERIRNLRKKQSGLMKELRKVDSEIAKVEGAEGGSSAFATPRRSLANVITEVLADSGKPMGVAQIADGARSKGYISSSSAFRAMVNQALIKDKRFKKHDRGIYALKK